MTAAEASDVRKSDIRNDGDSANDIYNVADVASKIDDNGAGDIVAVYMYDDDMGEKISIKGVSIALTANTITVGQDKVEVEVKLGTTVDSNLDVKNMYVQVVDKDGKVVIAKTNVTDAAQKLVLDTKALTEGTYTVQLFGYNKTDKNDDLLAEATLTVAPVKTYAVTDVEWVKDAEGTQTSDKPYIQAGTASSFYVKLVPTGTEPVAALTAKDLEVRIKDQLVSEQDIEVSKAAGDNVFKIVIKNKTIAAGDMVQVTLKSGGTLTFTGTAPSINAGAELGAPVVPPSPGAAKAGDIKVQVGTPTSNLLVQVLEGDGTRLARAARAAGAPITDLKSTDFNVTVNGTPVTVNATFDIGTQQYKLTSDSVNDWTVTGIKDVVITVGTCSETYDKVAAANAITDAKNTANYVKGSATDVTFTPTLTNLTVKDVQIKEGAVVTPTIGEDGVITVPAAELDKQSAGQVQFTLESKDQNEASTVKVEYTITVKNAPALTDALNAVQTAGVEKVTGQAAVYTGKFTAAAASETINLTVKSGQTEIVKLASHQTVKTTPTELAKEVADKLKEELAKKPEMSSKYTIANTGDKVTVTASDKTEGETLDIEFSGGSTTKFAKETGECKTGVADKAAVAGTLKFTIPAGVAENGNYKLVIDTDKSKNVTIAVTKEMTTEQIAGLVVTEVKKISELDASNSGAQVTITEKAGSEKQVFVDTTADDVVFTKQG